MSWAESEYHFLFTLKELKICTIFLRYDLHVLLSVCLKTPSDLTICYMWFDSPYHINHFVLCICCFGLHVIFHLVSDNLCVWNAVVYFSRTKTQYMKHDTLIWGVMYGWRANPAIPNVDRLNYESRKAIKYPGVIYLKRCGYCRIDNHETMGRTMNRRMVTWSIEERCQMLAMNHWDTLCGCMCVTKIETMK